MLRKKRLAQGISELEMVRCLRQVNPQMELDLYAGVEEQICLLPAEQLLLAAAYLECSPAQLVDKSQYVIPGVTEYAGTGESMEALKAIEAAEDMEEAAADSAAETLGPTTAANAAGEELAATHALTKAFSAEKFLSGELSSEELQPVVGILPLYYQQGLSLEEETRADDREYFESQLRCQQKQRVEFSFERNKYDWPTIKREVIMGRGFASRSQLCEMLLDFGIMCPHITAQNGRAVLERMTELYNRELAADRSAKLGSSEKLGSGEIAQDDAASDDGEQDNGE